LLDSDLAALYQVTTGNLNKAVHRKHDRFPDDFMFQLSPAEADSLRFQIGRSKDSTARGGRRFCPYAFTEQGIAMLSGVLNSARAVQVNIAIMRTFVRLRQLLPPTRSWRGGSTNLNGGRASRTAVFSMYSKRFRT
jgi:hypothetical protein